MPDIDHMISLLPRDEQLVVKRLRALVLECIPKATEKMYDDMIMPFYTHNKLICFIQPPLSVMDSTVISEKQKQKGVALGFNQGKMMANEGGILLSEGRKQVYIIYFKTINDIDEHQVRALLYEASMIDDGFGSKGKLN